MHCTDPEIVPPVQFSGPARVKMPGPARVPPLRLTIASEPPTPAPLIAKVPPATLRVWVPVLPPKVRANTVALAFTVTV